MGDYFSRFGGLWIDRTDRALVRDRIAAIGDRQLRGDVADFERDGFVILRNAVDPATIDRYLREYEIATATADKLLIYTPGHSHPAEPFDRALSLRPGTKMLDTAMLLETGPRLCFAPRVSRFLETLFEDAALAFQSLHFEVGSVQGIHQDTAYVVVADEPMRLCASWIALEDVQPGTGELTYYVGGHRLPEYVYSGQFKHFNPSRDGNGQHDTHYNRLHAEAARRGLRQSNFLAKKGDALIWHADLPHGGSPIGAPNRTRRSLVTHYCPLLLRPHYVQFVPENRRLIVAAGGGNAMSSMYYDPEQFFSVYI